MVQKWRKNATFLISTFKIFVGIETVRLRVTLWRDTEFSKQKYRKRGIFRKFVVAGDGFEPPTFRL